MSALAVKSIVCGSLMGLANLVPGVSAGAVLLATGIFQSFINAMADLAKFRFRVRPVALLGFLGVGWVCAVLLGAGVVKGLVVEHRWIMYSLFVGLTLGGVPLVWQARSERTPSFWIGAVVGFVIMAGLGAAQVLGVNIAGTERSSVMLLVIGGLLAAGATVLPGGSGTFVLLLMGLYVPVLSAVSEVKSALVARDIAALMTQAQVLAPLAVGMGLGLVTVSIITKWALAKHPRPTSGLLLGLLIGSVVGLLPFQDGVKPEVGQIFKGQAMTAEMIAGVKPDDWPVRVFAPSVMQVAVSLALIVAATVLTIWLTRVERRLGGT
jgi:putative membrane protein